MEKPKVLLKMDEPSWAIDDASALVAGRRVKGLGVAEVCLRADLVLSHWVLECWSGDWSAGGAGTGVCC